MAQPRWRARDSERRILVLAIGLTALILAGLIELSARYRETDGPERLADQTTVEGSGDHRETITLDGGLLVVRVGHNGSGAFAASLVDADGARTPLVGAVDAYRGVRGLPVGAGSYQLEIAAAGRWAVGLEQPSYTAGVALPVTVEGDGDSISDPFEVAEDDVSADGLAVDVRTEEGQGVSLRVLDVAGSPVAEVDAPEGPSRLDPLPAGIWLLDVRTTGVWRVDLVANDEG